MHNLRCFVIRHQNALIATAFLVSVAALTLLCSQAGFYSLP